MGRRSAGEVELGNFQIAGLGDLEVALRALDDEDRHSGAFEEACFVGAGEFVRCRFGESFAHKRDQGALGCLCMHDQLARDGGDDDGAVGGALDLLDGVDCRCANDGGTVFFDGIDGAGDGGGVDEWADGIVDENDVVVRCGGKRVERIGDRVLPVIAANDDVDSVFHAVLGDQREDAGFFRGPDRDVDRRDARDRKKRLERVLKNGQAPEGEELFGSASCGGHTGADTGGGENNEYGHGKLSIAIRR